MPKPLHELDRPHLLRRAREMEKRLEGHRQLTRATQEESNKRWLLLEGTRAALKQSLAEQEKALQQRDAANAGLKAQEGRIVELEQAYNKSVDDLQKANEDLQSQVAGRDETIARANAQISRLQSALDEHRTALTHLKRENNSHLAALRIMGVLAEKASPADRLAAEIRTLDQRLENWANLAPKQPA